MNRVRRYDIRGKQILTRMDKFYLTDMGLGTIKSTGFKPEFGAYERIADNYPKYVLSMDHFDFSRNGIIHKNILDFLMEP